MIRQSKASHFSPHGYHRFLRARFAFQAEFASGTFGIGPTPETPWSARENATHAIKQNGRSYSAAVNSAARLARLLRIWP